jgi:hypothetical protein
VWWNSTEWWAVITVITASARGALRTDQRWHDADHGSSRDTRERREAHHGELLRHALAVIGVANYDDSSQAELENFVKESGASFPVSADTEHRILNALPPSGWGQAIVIVDAEGIVRLVHRGTREGAYEEVDRSPAPHRALILYGPRPTALPLRLLLLLACVAGCARAAA